MTTLGGVRWSNVIFNENLNAYEAILQERIEFDTNSFPLQTEENILFDYLIWLPYLVTLLDYLTAYLTNFFFDYLIWLKESY